MKPYDELPWWCQLLDPWFGPPWYTEIEDFDAWLAAVRQHLAGWVDELTDELAGDDIPGEEYLAKAGRLTAARHQAEEITRHEYGTPTPEDEEDCDDEDDRPVSGGERPMVVDRAHQSWAEVDAEQRERLGIPPGEAGLP